MNELNEIYLKLKLSRGICKQENGFPAFEMLLNVETSWNDKNYILEVIINLFDNSDVTLSPLPEYDLNRLIADLNNKSNLDNVVYNRVLNKIKSYCSKLMTEITTNRYIQSVEIIKF